MILQKVVGLGVRAKGWILKQLPLHAKLPNLHAKLSKPRDLTTKSWIWELFQLTVPLYVPD